MPPDVRRTAIRPVVEAAVAAGALVHADECDVHARLEAWGHGHETVRHGRGECARDGDGDGSREARVSTAEGPWSPPRSWPRPHRGVSRERLPVHLGFFQVVHDARRRGKALLATLVGGSVA